MRCSHFLFVGCLAASGPALAQTTGLGQVREQQNNPLPTAPKKTLEELSYDEFMEIDPVRRKRVLHLISPDRQYELVAAHLARMLELHRRDLSDEQERFLLSTVEGLEPRDFVRRRAMDQASLMRAWLGDRLGRLYRETDVDAVRALFSGHLRKEIFSLE